VAVGPRGVFLIETKARRRHVVKDAEPTHKVTYDGQGLRFPDRKDSDTIPQAVRNTDWLTKFLTKRAGEPITVQPLVVLPGWYIETKGNFPVKVMNARYLEGYLRSQPATLDPAQVSRIVAALEDKCRDVEF
jgi:hypothetical protein